MTTLQFLMRLEDEGIHLVLEGTDRFRVKAKRKGALTPEIKTELRARKPEILEILQRAGSTETAAIPRLAEGQTPPVSPTQQRLWFLSQLDPDDVSYNIPTLVRLDGPLDSNALRRALEMMARRHHVLRSRIVRSDEEPIQEIGEVPDDILVIADLSAEPDPRARAVEAAIRAQARPFDLTSPPLWHIYLYRLASNRHMMLLVMHHIISDGWSLGIFFRELAVCYRDVARAGRAEPVCSLAPLPIQYGDYAAWQQARLQGAELDRQMVFWEAQLAGSGEPLDLPIDKPRPDFQTHAGKSRHFQLDPLTVTRADALAREVEATRFMVHLTGLTVLLGRLARADDIAIGTPVANRSRPELEGLIGFFVNTLVIRSRLDDDPDFNTLLARTKQTVLSAFDHADIPFEKLIERLHPRRDLSTSPIFQVMYSLVEQREEQKPLPMGPLTLTPEPYRDEIAQYDLSIMIVSRPQRTELQINYNTDLFEDATIEAMARSYTNILGELCAHPDRPVSRARYLDEAETHALAESFAGNRAEYPRDVGLHHLVRERAERTPEAVALIRGDQRLTYRELWQRVEVLAGVLLARGEGTDPVGLCLDRSVELIVAMLAILESGAAYLPLDPDYPEERLAFMIEDSGTRVIITRDNLLPIQNATAEVLDIVDLEREAGTVSRPALVRPFHADQAAYIIYTSGSTGRPKGTVLSHRGPANLVFAAAEAYGIDARDRILQFATINFDVSVEEIFVALGHGATLVLRPGEFSMGPEEMAELVTETALTTLFLPTAWWHEWTRALSAGDKEIPPSVNKVIVAGEKADAGVLTVWSTLKGAERIRWTNAYGPTEASVIATCHTVHHGSRIGKDVPIGSPLTNLDALILAPNGEPVVGRMAGELHLGGPALARGYHHMAATTAERFVPHPYAAIPGARLYKTGDLCRRNAAGEIVFVGRTDFQVKVRGYRVEPGEIERALGAHPGVSQAVVITRADALGANELVAYVVTSDKSLDHTALRDWLSGRLADYLMPSAFALLDELPLNPNGKVDRGALPEPERAANREPVFTEPEGPVEAELASLFAELLRVDRVGREANFFEHGGHSLLATRLVSRLKTQLGVDIPLRAIFARATVRALAETVSQQQATNAETRPAITVVTRVPEGMPLSTTQERQWFLDRLEGEAGAYNLPTALRFRGGLSPELIEEAFTLLVARHEGLRTRFVTVDEVPLQIVDPPSAVTLDRRDFRDHEDPLEAGLFWLREKARLGFDLEHGPLFRLHLARIGVDDHLLLLVMHHIISDGWTMDVLASELAEIFAANRENRPVQLAPLEHQYVDYAVWQKRYDAGDRSAADLDWWQAFLAGAPNPIDLPTDFPRPPRRSFDGEVCVVPLDPGVMGNLVALAETSGATTFMAGVAVMALVLSRYCASDDIPVGTPIANRPPGMEGVVGMFANTLVLRADLSGDPDFRALLARIKAMALDVFDHQDTPFEQVVDCIQPERNLSYSPLFQVMFATFESEPVPTMTGLEIQPIEITTHAEKFDLTTTLSRTGGAWTLQFSYRTDLFREETVRRLGLAFRTLTSRLVVRPDLALSRISEMEERERARILEVWSHNPDPCDTETTLDALFMHQVRRRPDAPACGDGDRMLSFAELAESTEALAGQLCANGVGLETIVPVAIEQSIELIVAVIACWRAGAAYLALDVDQPVARLQAIVEEVGAPVVLCRSDRKPALDRTLLAIDEKGSVPHPIRPSGTRFPEQLAYLIFTSGSTGKPKGVSLAHRGVVNLIHGLRRMTYGPEDGGLRVAVNAPLFFDASVQQLVALLMGHCLFPIPRDLRLTPSALLAWLAENRIDVLDGTPSHIQLLMEEGLDTNAPYPSRVLVGGEDIEPRIWDRMARSGTRYFNLYGPSECTVDAVAREISLDVDRPAMGRPMADFRTLVLDRRLGLVPPGVAGELFIAGVGVGRGYFGRPALTAERFLPDPFAGEPGGRLYRTGDLVRMTPGGEMVFRGRIDFQVKLRGYRIELAEIESALIDLEGIIEAVVLLRRDLPTGDALIAYLRSEEGAAPIDYSGALARRLPAYMIPAHFEVMTRFPLTHNGKLDRRALPVPELEVRVFSEPEGEVERSLAGIFGELLSLDPVGRNDDFFLAGGHSLLATRLISRVRERLGVDLPLRALFDAPVLSDLARVIEQSSIARTPPLTRVSREVDPPLSFAQERMWFLARLNPDSSAYNIPLTARLHGPLDHGCLERAISHLVSRHEGLRTRFLAIDGAAVQHIDPPEPWRIERTDLTNQSLDDARAIARSEASHVFDIEKGPLFRVRLLVLAPEDHVLLLTMHHIITDGWSMGVFQRELAVCYAAEAAGHEPVLPELPVDYRDFAHWQRGWLRDEVLDRQLAWWRDRLVGAPEDTPLPTDYPAPAVQTFRGGSHDLMLDPESTRGLRDLAAARNATVFMTLLAPFAVLIMRLSARDDITIGTPVAGRGRGELEHLIGLFVNTLVLRLDRVGDPDWTSLLDRVRSTALDTFAHGDIPFEKVVDAVLPQRDLSRNALFSIMFSLAVEEEPGGELIEGLRSEPFTVETEVTRFDLSMTITDHGDRLSLHATYRRELFSPETIVRFCDYYRRLIEAMVADPYGRPFRETLLPVEEVDWVRRVSVCPHRFQASARIEERFSDRVRQHPDREAVCDRERRLTFGELDVLANGLAHALIEHGVGPGEPVAIAVRPGASMIVCVLGILKAGGVCLPIDREQPDQRLEAICADAGVSVLLSEEARALKCTWIDPATMIPHRNPPGLGVGIEAPAYLIYTSGSTGRPKGVSVSHCSALNLLDGLGKKIHDPTVPARITVNAPLYFDSSVKQWLTLLWGYTLFPISREDRLEPERMITWLSRQGISVLDSTPAHLRIMIEAGLLDRVECLTMILIGGEDIDPGLWRALVESDVRCFNVYGPTECTVDALGCEIEGDLPNLGTPFPNYQTWLLDEALGLVPRGVTAELMIGGAGLASGYHNRPALTAERFIPDPISGASGARLYRTGDLARRLDNGSLVFHGRLDHQVKVRGNRVELGEIEAALSELDGVVEAVVLFRRDLPNGEALVAYVRSESGGLSLDPRAALGQRLPAYMVPTHLEVMDRFPMTPNGKIDRRALPVPKLETSEYRAPRGRIEEALADIYAELLVLDRVSRDEDFFLAGGHSLMAVRLISRIRDRLAVELPLRALFDSPVLADLAETIAEASLERAPPLTRARFAGPPPLSFAQERMWFLDRLNPGTSAYNVPVSARLRGKLDREALREAFTRLIARHEGLRTRFEVTTAGPVQQIDHPSPCRLHITDLRGETEGRAREIAREEAATVFDLARGPLFRAHLLVLGDDDHVLLLTLHHIITDGWSMGLLQQELAELYAAVRTRRSPELVELPIRYRDFAQWQRDWLRDETLERRLAWWRDQLAGLPEDTPLPTDRIPPARQSFSGGIYRLRLEGEGLDALRVLAASHRASLFMALLTPFVVMIMRLTGRDDVAIGTPVAGRDRGELEGLIGLFVNTLVLRLRREGNPDWQTFIEDIRKVALDTFAHGDIPFEKVVEAALPSRDLSRNALFSVMFSVAVEDDRDERAIGDLRSEPFEVPTEATRFDLSVTVNDRGDHLSINATYRDELFDETTIARFGALYRRLIHAMVRSPQSFPFRLALLDDTELEAVMAASVYRREIPPARRIEALFAERVRLHPDREAVCDNQRRLDYQTLYRLANGLAHVLVAVGVRPGDRVAIAVRPGTAMIVSVLGVLGAGAVCLPIDREQPDARLRALCADAGARHLLSKDDRDLGLSLISPENIEPRNRPPVLDLGPDAPAYLIYTSGSTGRPKGVLVSHRAAVNLLAGLAEMVHDPESPARITVNAPLYFDSSVKQWLTLAWGYTLFPIDREDRLDATRMIDLLAREEITVLDSTPSHLRVLLAEGLLDRVPSLERILIGGEAIDPTLWRTAAASSVRCTNLYGPTECTVDALGCLIQGDVPTLGTPFPNYHIWLLDEALQPVPIGVTAELYIGGEGLAYGYWDRPGLTAERFLPDPFATEPGTRLYRTGDLARRTASGALGYVGRTDHQVKVRGNRVELGEIESALGELPGIDRAVVLLRRDLSIGEALIAYVSLAEGGRLAEAREALAKRLPGYMMPAHFEVIDHFPLTPNGKVDRRALPTPDLEGQAGTHPEGPTEAGLADLFTEILGVSRVHREDDFFQLGGHSLLATRTMIRIRQQFHVELPLRALFENPVLSDLAGLIDSYFDEERLPPPRPAPRPPEGMPLSLEQERLWFLDCLYPGDTRYNMTFASRIRGPLDRARLEATFAYLFMRHEALRTYIVSEGDQARQRFLEPDALQFSLNADLTEAEALEAITRLSVTPFDLARGPLFRVSLFVLGPDHHLLCVGMHHIISDGWSINILAQEMATVYEQLEMRDTPSLQPLELQYADIAWWQRHVLPAETLDHQLDYWEAKLEGAPPLIELPLDFPRTTDDDHRGDRVSFHLDGPLVDRLESLGRRVGGTPFVTWLSVFATFLGRHCGQTDIAIGTPIANRGREGTESLVGFFANTLVLRADLAGRPGFDSLLGRMRTVVLEAFDHADAPFEKLVERIAPERTGHSPLFQVAFLLTEDEREGTSITDELEIETLPLTGADEKFDLMLTLSRRGDGLSGVFSYRRCLFERETINAFTERLAVLIGAVVDDSAASIADVPIMSDRERETILGLNPDAVPVLSDELIHELFIRQAEIDSSRPALSFRDETLSYGMLYRRASRLAHLLVSSGIGPERVVGLYMRREPDLVVAVFATLMAGGAYLSLDPSYPADRLAFMIEDGDCAFVLTNMDNLDGLPEIEVPVFHFARDAALLEGRLETPPPRVARTSNLAYLIYTSGSTGKPKAVAVAHETVCALVHWAHRVYSAEELACCSVVTSFNFDFSVFELFAPLSWGGSAVLLENALDLINCDHPISLICSVPSAARELLESGAIPASVKTVNIGGEAVKRSLVLDFYARAGVERFFNVYGPTEDCVLSTSSLQPRDLTGEPTLGLPLDNEQVYITDQALRPVPIGVRGELLLGGTGLVRGYLGRPALTAEKWVPNPFGPPGSRLYRTGDATRFDHDGVVVYMGRIDHQVKIRGFRIEIGEIEAQLAAHPQIEEAAVIAWGEGHLRYLAAYLLCSEEDIPEQVLREYLGGSLPEYMVPARFVIMATMPLTPSGKIDRRRLPEPTVVTADDFVEPIGETEIALAGLFAELLGIEGVSRFDDFFHSGGHSLMATRLVNRVRDTFDVALPLRAIFENPRLDDLARAVEEARAHKVDTISISPVPREQQGMPLSYNQERLWFLQQLYPDDPGYNVPMAVRFRGPLDPLALIRAFDFLVVRHEILRTRIVEVGSGPRQRIDEPGRFSVGFIDWTALPLGKAEAACLESIAASLRRPFDLAEDDLFRVEVHIIGAGDHAVAMNMHHIIVDGWSQEILNRELGIAYRSFLGGRAPDLVEPRLHYADYAWWVRKHLAGEVLAAELAWWTRRLAGIPTLLNLPTDGPRRPHLAADGGVVTFTVPASVAGPLNARGRQAGATVFMTWLSLFSALLSRFSGQDDICLGTPVANRSMEGSEDIPGFFANTLVLRTDHSGDPDFMTLLARARTTVLEAFEHEDTPFEMIVDRLQPERTGQSPLFQVMYILREADEEPELEGLAGLTSEPIGLGSQTEKFDLTLFLVTRDGGLDGRISFRRALFRTETIQRMADQLVALARGLLATPDRSVCRIDLCGDEARALMAELNDTERSYPSGLLHQRFAYGARSHGDRPALIFDDRVISYGELDRRVDVLAGWLRAHGIGPERTVGLALDRTPDLVIGILAILRSGGAYLPLDPTYPEDRLSFMIEDAGCALILTDSSSATSLPPNDSRLFCVDREVSGTDPRHAATPAVEPGNLAYLIYTSGSTGKPKAVAINHAPAHTLVQWAREVFDDDDLSMCLHATSFNFDLSVFELFVPLSWGGTVVLVENALALPRVRQPISLVNTVPSAARELVAMNAVPETVRVVSLAGEPLKRRLVDDLYRAGVGRVLNLYGPSEDTTYSTWGVCPSVSEEEPSIGKPLANTRAHLLDRFMGPVPPGVPGELFLAGSGLARGYAGRPALTASRWLPDPFASEPGERLYRTGDLVRYLPGGALGFLGRIDHQVKIRGFRVEVGEIEARLIAHVGVSDAAVMAWGESSNRYLAAYVVAPSVDEETLRDHLRAGLPEYMVPARFCYLDALPLTPNGKVNRRAFVEPERVRSKSALPEGPTEQALAEIYSGILGGVSVGRDDDFFRLGGHSLLATRVMAEIRSRFSLDLPLRALFEEPVVRRLAALIEGDELGSRADTFRVEPVSREPQGMPLSYNQERLWFLQQLYPEDPGYNMPMAMFLDGPLEQEKLAFAFSRLVRRHEILRARFVIRDGAPVQLIDPPEAFAMVFRDWDDVGPDTREAACIEAVRADLTAPFDLALGPNYRVWLHRLASERHILAISMHHIISDGWSMRLMMDELAESMAAEELGTVESPPVGYLDYAVCQRRHLTGALLERRLRWWQDHLQGLPSLLELPTDYPRRPHLSSAAERYRFTVPSRTVTRLESLGRADGATPFMSWLTVFAVVLARHANQFDFSLGTPVANREIKGTEDMLGFFANTLVLRCDLSGDPDFHVLLARCRRGVLDAFDHQDTPFEMVVDRVQPERTGHGALFQVMFQLEEGLDDESEGASTLAARPLGTERHFAKFDLTLVLNRSRGGLHGSITYRTALFREATVAALIDRLVFAASELADHPERRLSRLSLVSVEERALLESWGANPLEIGEPKAIGDLFNEVASRYPDRLALVFRETRYDYAALERASRAISSHLMAKGLSPGSRIGLLMPRGADSIVALLGILRAGSTVVPMDTAHPENRWRTTVEDAGMKALLHGEDVVDLSLPTILIPFTTALEEGMVSGETVPMPRVEPEELAYVIFTSGSTGRPKGVAITHRSVHAFLLGMLAVVPGAASGGRRVSLNAPLVFDASVQQWVCLLNGDTLYPATAEERLSGSAMVAYVTENRLDLLDCTPSHLRIMLAAGLVSDSYTVPTVLVGGEAVDPELWKTMADAPDTRFFNVYGPTEHTVDATIAEVVGSRPVLGRPWPNVEIHLLDESGSPSPIGIPGEICLGGPSGSRGYFGRPSLTAARFIPDAYSESGGSRLYRTGDLALYRRSGELVYIGRTDDQVKVRGYRIEIGEIEVALAAHASIRDVAVKVWGEGKHRYLAAYLVAEGEPPDQAELRAHLLAHLPEYMVPARFVFMEALPLTPNGKIDRRGLLEGELSEPDFRAPATATERVLAEIWIEALGVERVGRDDTWFALGGNSLSTVGMLGRVRERLGRHLPVSSVFIHPGLAALARWIERAPTEHGALVRIGEGDGDKRWVLVHPIGGQVHWFFPLARALNSQVWAIQAPGLNEDLPSESLTQRAARYLDMLVDQGVDGPWVLVGWSFGGRLAFEMAIAARARGLAVEDLVLIDAPILEEKKTIEDTEILDELAREQVGMPLPADVMAVLATTEKRDRPRVLIDWLEDQGVMRVGFDREWLERMVAVYSGHREMAVSWSPSPYAGNARLIRANATVESMIERGEDGETMGWSQLIGGTLSVRDIAGDHYSIFEEERAEELANLLTETLQDTR